jgi:hypothetical protein
MNQSVCTCCALHSSTRTISDLDRTIAWHEYELTAHVGMAGAGQSKP